MSQATFSSQCRTIDATFVEILGHDVDLRRVAGVLAVQTAIDVADKFELWKGNSGSVHPPESMLSLEARLVNAPHLRRELHDLLESLQETLQNATNIIIGLRDNHTFLKEAYSQVDQIPEDLDLTKIAPVTSTEITEVEDLLGIASDTIGSLLRLVILVRKATPRDRHAHALRDQHEPFTDLFDINYVRERYPKLDRPESQWLLERLGRAITIRRQFLRYFREHKERLAGSSQHSDSLNPHSVKASTFDHSRFAKNKEPTHEDAEDVASYISVTTSVAVPPEDTTLQLPTLSDIKKRGPKEISPRVDELQPTSQSDEFFECPLCAGVISIKHERSWKLHVHEDLKSYICCLGKGLCDSKMFGNQREWFNHELENHRHEWICIVCRQGPFEKPESFHDHLMQEHPELNTSNQTMEALKAASQRPVKSISTRECPFCNDWDPRSRTSKSGVDKGKSKAKLAQDGNVAVSPNNFRRHLAIHLEQLAIFAIPRAILDPTEPQGGSDRAHIAHSSQSSLASAVEKQDSSPQEDLSINFGHLKLDTQPGTHAPISSPEVVDEATAEMRVVHASTPAESSGPLKSWQNTTSLRGSSEPSGNSQLQSTGLEISLPVERDGGDSAAVPLTPLAPNPSDWQSTDPELLRWSRDRFLDVSRDRSIERRESAERKAERRRSGKLGELERHRKSQT
ncbi:hypothetical protein BJ166DRAFT_378545 [Pestalotiopsis sp. NC0098]|nr:hypothetical protein BJ166DRAFT_378545 [Pestalotiopsis sp. NC0098]